MSSHAILLGGAPGFVEKQHCRRPLHEDRQWIEIANTGYPDYRRNNHTMLDGLSLMGWFATVSSRAMVTPMLGKGSVYMWTYTSGDGEWLDGAKSYSLRLPSGIPAAAFWSIVVYDVWTRSMLANGQPEASKNSYNPDLVASDDGSVEVFFGPE